MAEKQEISKDFLTKAKGFLRITTNDTVIDTEITTLIRACQGDLIRNGITPHLAYDLRDSLIEMAVLLYLKAEFGLDNKNYDKFRASYDELRTELALTNDYITEKKVSEYVE